ncbi:MAG: hypothetical protein U0350_47620 [Caldilineaceae bacterium]
MKKLLGLILLVFIGVIAWRIGGSLSSDAVSMAVGVLFGIMAGIPTALLVLASDRRRNEQAEMRREPYGRERGPYGGYPQNSGYLPYPQQPPVIVLTGAPSTQSANYGANPSVESQHYFQPPPADMAGRRARQFRVVGEKETWVDEW